MHSQHKRSDKVGHMLQQELATLLLHGVKDPRVGFVTVTEVRLTDDLRTARIYVSVYGTDEERNASLAGLRGATPYLRRELVRRVRMQYAPELVFVADESLERVSRLEQVFTAISKGDAAIAEDAPPEIVPVVTDRSALAKSVDLFDKIEQDAAQAEAARAERVTRRGAPSRSATRTRQKPKPRTTRR